MMDMLSLLRGDPPPAIPEGAPVRAHMLSDEDDIPRRVTPRQRAAYAMTSRAVADRLHAEQAAALLAAIGDREMSAAELCAATGLAGKAVRRVFVRLAAEKQAVARRVPLPGGGRQWLYRVAP